MSLVTRCTSCGTLFKVVADQLKISEGWVRCGQCATVFDAQANLVEALQHNARAPAAQEPLPPAAFTSHAPLASSASDADSLRDSALDAKDQEALLAAFASVNVPVSLPAKEDSSAKISKPIALSANLASADHDASHLDSQAFRPGTLRSSSELESDAGPSTSSWAPSEYPPRGASASLQAQDMAPLHTLPDERAGQNGVQSAPASLEPQAMPQFVQLAQRAARWRSPAVRFGLALVALVLMAALALQIALHEKDRIAAQWPQTKPWLEQLCQQAGCKIAAFKRIEAIAVDSSSFNRINKNNAQIEAVTQSYRLAVTLKNTGALPVAAPHVELSLQDAQDQPILRRVLSPAELGINLTALAPAQDMAGSITVQIDTAQLAGSKIQGYRVLAFYP